MRRKAVNISRKQEENNEKSNYHGVDVDAGMRPLPRSRGGVAQEQPLSSPANLVKELADGELLPGYQVDGKTNLPFPDDWNIKAGKVGGAVTFVNNDGTVRTAASGIFFAAEMPLTAALTSEVTEYTVSAKVTPKERGDWGGVGILIGWHNEAPSSYF